MKTKMKIKMKIKLKYKVYMPVPITQLGNITVSQPQTIKKPNRIRKPIFAFPRLVFLFLSF
jgi:hypothetical protein